MDIKKVEDTVKVFYNADTYELAAEADEDQVREAMAKEFPEVANADIEQDDDTGNWTITRAPGEKG